MESSGLLLEWRLNDAQRVGTEGTTITSIIDRIGDCMELDE
jgi:hypothetical protein